MTAKQVFPQTFNNKTAKKLFEAISSIYDEVTSSKKFEKCHAFTLSKTSIKPKSKPILGDFLHPKKQKQ